MKKFEHVDLIKSLFAIMQSNTTHYQSDFEFDKETIRNAAKSNNKEDKYLLFMSRSTGTYCMPERNVFIKGSTPYTTWKFYGEQSHDKILAYAVEVEKITDNTVIGNLYELDYQKHYQHIIQTAVPADNILIHYEHGDKIQPVKESIIFEHPELGAFISFDDRPNDENALKAVLQAEHRDYKKKKSAEIQTYIKRLKHKELTEKAYGLFVSCWADIETGFTDEKGSGNFEDFCNKEFLSTSYMHTLLSEQDFKEYMALFGLVEGVFTSVWDDGIIVSSDCIVNLATHEIENIGENDYPGDDGELDILQKEYVTIGDKEYRVTDSDSYDDALQQCPDDEWLYY